MARQRIFAEVPRRARMLELIDRSRMRRLDLPRAFLQDMLLPFRGRAGARYSASWGADVGGGTKRFEVVLESFTPAAPRPARALKLRKSDGLPRISRKSAATLGPLHADLFVALHAIDQSCAESGGRASGDEVMRPSYQTLWRAAHAFRPCKNYSGAWKRKAEQALDELQHCTCTFIDRGDGAERSTPLTVSGPLLRVFWVEKVCTVARRELRTRSIERIFWGPAIRHMLDQRLTLTFRADEYFGIESAPARIAYLFTPAPAAARARDTARRGGVDVVPGEFSQDSAKLLMKLGYAPEEISDRYCRHRLLEPLQAALDRKALANGHLSVALVRHRPPDGRRPDWRLSLRVLNRRPPHAAPVEDVTFLAAQEGGRTKNELYSRMRHIPDLADSEARAIDAIWPRATHLRAVNWARKAKAFMGDEDRALFTEILAEVKMLKETGYRFRIAAAAMAVGLTHQLLRTHEWPLPQRRRPTGPPP